MVTNLGEPIPEAALPNIFTPFWQHSTSTARQGLGLGLFSWPLHLQSDRHAHGGSLEVIPDRGTGTTFAARLPIQGLDAGDLPDE